MVADEVVTSATTCRGTIHHIGHGSIMSDKIEICRGKGGNGVAQVACRGKGLEKDLGQEYRRADIKVSTLFQVGNQATEELEVMVAGLADIGP